MSDVDKILNAFAQEICLTLNKELSPQEFGVSKSEWPTIARRTLRYLEVEYPGFKLEMSAEDCNYWYDRPLQQLSARLATELILFRSDKQ